MTNEAKLAEAETALHQLLLGSKVVEVTKSDGSKVKFSMANTAQLRVYIEDLKAVIGGKTNRRRAIGVHF